MKTSLFNTLQLFAILAVPNLLPEQLPKDYLSEQAFIPFQEPASSFSPLYSSLMIDGVAANQSTSDANRLFFDRALALIPAGSKIQKLIDSKGREIWSYPLGTEVAHEISFTDISHTPFELRMIRKISETEWDFASYSLGLAEGVKEPVLIRHHYVGTAPFTTNLQMTSTKNSKIELTRINLVSCKNCHFMNSPASYQYPTRNEAGPCGFAPGNDSGIKSWIDTFKAVFGYSPF